MSTLATDTSTRSASTTTGTSLPTMRGSLQYDLPAALVVFLVAVPLCLGIALASGAPMLSGIISGVVGGVVVSLLSGSHVSVSGPAAGLVVVVATSVISLGSYEAFLTAVVVAGVMQLAFGALRLGVIGEYVPNCVIKGMLAGIGVVIILKQIPHALGRDSDFSGDQGFFQSFDGENTLSEIMLAWIGVHPLAVAITISSLIIMFLWEKEPIKSSRFKLFFPAPLLVVILGAILAPLGAPFDPSFSEVVTGNHPHPTSHFVTIPSFASIAQLLGELPSPDWSALTDRRLWGVAFTVALLASIESLLSIEAADKLDPFRRISSTNRELFAQGAGNICAGMLGGLPVTAVVVRSSANIYAGGRTRVSGILHGVFIALSIVLIPQLLNTIPFASLSAILIAVGYKLTPPSLFRSMYAAGGSQFGPFLVTVVGIVFTDLLTGVVVGMALGLYFVFKTNHHDAVTVVFDQSDYLVRFNKDISFLNKSELKEALASIPGNTRVLIDGTKAMFIDQDIYDIINDFSELAEYRGITIKQKNMDLKSLPAALHRWRKNVVIPPATTV
jgi:MFS superfamily sulfate permease-like transporter